MATQDSDEFENFIDQCRLFGLANVKALEAHWDSLPHLSESAKEMRQPLVNVLKMGAEYARAYDEAVREGKI